MLEHAIEISCSEVRIANFLNRNASQFTPPLSQRIEISDYSKKLSVNAVNIFLSSRGRDLGHAAIYTNKTPEAFLSSFCVDCDHQRAGIGLRLMLAVINSCKDNGIEILTLEVSKKNHRARFFYKKHGFNIISQDGTREVMIRTLF